jgi:hypothetical protein
LKALGVGFWRKVFGFKRHDVTGSLGMPYNVELHRFYSSRNIVTMIKLTRMRLKDTVARMGRREGHINF